MRRTFDPRFRTTIFVTRAEREWLLAEARKLGVKPGFIISLMIQRKMAVDGVYKNSLDTPEVS